MRQMWILCDEETGKVDTSAMKLQDGLRSLTNSFQELSAAAETIHAEEQVAKKARLGGQEPFCLARHQATSECGREPQAGVA